MRFHLATRYRFKAHDLGVQRDIRWKCYLICYGCSYLDIHLCPPEGTLGLGKFYGAAVFNFDEFCSHDQIAVTLVNCDQICHLDDTFLDT